jgi:hypothetical protein
LRRAEAVVVVGGWYYAGGGDVRLRGAIFSISIKIKRLANWLAYILHCLWMLVAKIYLIGNHR